MSKGKLAGIIAACAAAIIATIFLVPSPPRETTSEMNDYAIYVLEQCTEATHVALELFELVEEPLPHNPAWQNETTNRMEQLDEIRTELTATRPPTSLCDRQADTADAIYETALGVLDSLTSSSHFALDYAHAMYSGDAVAAGGYLTGFLAETERFQEYHTVLQFLVTLIPDP